MVCFGESRSAGQVCRRPLPIPDLWDGKSKALSQAERATNLRCVTSGMTCQPRFHPSPSG